MDGTKITMNKNRYWRGMIYKDRPQKVYIRAKYVIQGNDGDGRIRYWTRCSWEPEKANAAVFRSMKTALIAMEGLKLKNGWVKPSEARKKQDWSPRSEACDNLTIVKISDGEWICQI